MSVNSGVDCKIKEDEREENSKGCKEKAAKRKRKKNVPGIATRKRLMVCVDCKMELAYRYNNLSML